MTKIILIFVLSIMGISLVASPVLALEPLIQCGGRNQQECKICDIFKLVQRIFQYLLYFLGISSFAVGIIIGYMFFLGAHNEAALGNAKKAATAAVVGFLLTLFAWVIVSGVGRSLSWKEEGADGFNWMQINCDPDFN